MKTLESCSENYAKVCVSEATDTVLVAQAKSGDHSAFGELWNRHVEMASNMAKRITKNADDTEDVVQDAWMKAYVHLKSFDGRSKFSTWLMRIVINSALMILRRRHLHSETSMEFRDGEIWESRDFPDQSITAEDLYVQYEGAERLRQAISRLQPSLRSVIEIYQLNDTSMRDIAKIAGISVSATKSRMLRARTILRRTLVRHTESNFKAQQMGIRIGESEGSRKVRVQNR